MQTHFDIIIVGKGLVGLAFALALQDTTLSIALIEAKPLAPFPVAFSRPLSLNEISCQILKKLGVWETLAGEATPITGVHISEQHRFGAIRLSATECKVPALGHVVDIATLFSALQEKTKLQKNITCIQPATVKNITFNEHDATLHITTECSQHTLTATLVVVADGHSSTLSKLLNLHTEEYDYQESAITATVNVSKPHGGMAFERFTKEGTIALLPRASHAYGLVISAQKTQANTLLALEDAAFLTWLQTQMGYRAGSFQNLSKRALSPLKYFRAHERVKQNVILLGNASQTLHPVAAQGFNVGLVDAATLADYIQAKPSLQTAMKEQHLLQTVDAVCAQHQNQVIDFTKAIVAIYHHQTPAVSCGRGFMLHFLGLSPSFRQKIAKFGMGHYRKSTHLAHELA